MPSVSRPEHVERIGLHLGVGGALQCQQADLGPVAVADDELVLHGHRSERLGSDANVAALVLGSHRLSPPQKGMCRQGL